MELYMALKEQKLYSPTDGGIHPSVADLADPEESALHFHFIDARPQSTSIERWESIFTDLVYGTINTIVPDTGERESLHPHGLSQEEFAALQQLLTHHT